MHFPAKYIGYVLLVPTWLVNQALIFCHRKIWQCCSGNVIICRVDFDWNISHSTFGTWWNFSPGNYTFSTWVSTKFNLFKVSEHCWLDVLFVSYLKDVHLVIWQLTESHALNFVTCTLWFIPFWFYSLVYLIVASSLSFTFNCSSNWHIHASTISL